MSQLTLAAAAGAAAAAAAPAVGAAAPDAATRPEGLADALASAPRAD